jgi:hypothetical protein
VQVTNHLQVVYSLKRGATPPFYYMLLTHRPHYPWSKSPNICQIVASEDHTTCLEILRKIVLSVTGYRKSLPGYSTSISEAIPTEPSGTTRMNMLLYCHECINYFQMLQTRNLLLLIAWLGLYSYSVPSTKSLGAAALKGKHKLRP